jgi:hypothetical protein
MNSDTRYKVCTVASWTQNLNTFIEIVKHFYCFYQTFNQIRFPTTCTTIAKNYQGLKVLLVDERSLIGGTNLGWMEFMCKSGTGVESKSWGGLP